MSCCAELLIVFRNNHRPDEFINSSLIDIINNFIYYTYNILPFSGKLKFSFKI